MKNFLSRTINISLLKKEPVSLVHFITSRCNARCPMCSRHTYMGYIQPELDQYDLSENIFYKFFTEEKSYIEKFDNKTNQWFRAKCKNTTIDSVECISDIEFTDLSQNQIEHLLYSKGNNKENIQLNSHLS